MIWIAFIVFALVTIVVAWLSFYIGYGYRRGEEQMERIKAMGLDEKIARINSDMTTEEAMRAAGIGPMKTETTYGMPVDGRALLSEEESAALFERLEHDRNGGRLH